VKRIILLFLIVIFLAGCTSSEIKQLQSLEVQEYQGEKLGSIGDFRENSIKGPQYIDIDNYNLQITGLVENPVSYTYDEVLNNQKYNKVVQLNCVEGWSVNILWEGILLKDVLEEAKISPEANTIIFYAYDGYSTSFPIEYIQDNDLILAYKMNNITLPSERGFPFQLVAESKWGYKWIKWITKIELSNDIDYEGYWESRGYSDTGDLDKRFIK
jgi:DMSO/TMAO reductase YedYZ molybdopterin-dependent catalytic subunit